MHSVAGPGRGVRAPRLSGASRASTEGARARAATSRESYRLVRLSAERQREPSRACHGEGHRQRGDIGAALRSEEHTSELQSQSNIVCRLLLEKKKNIDVATVCHH